MSERFFDTHTSVGLIGTVATFASDLTAANEAVKLCVGLATFFLLSLKIIRVWRKKP